MKKFLLSVAVLAATLSANAQLNVAGDGFNLDNLDGASNCYANFAPNNGGIMANGGSFTGANELTANGLVLISEATIATDAIWYSFPAVVDDACSNLNGDDKGVDMSANGKVSMMVKSNVAGATLDFFLGSTGQYFPSTSTFNNGLGKSVIATITFANADELIEVIFDYNDLGSSDANVVVVVQDGDDVWGDFTGRNKIQSYGFRTATENAQFTITEIKVGSEASMTVSSQEVIGSNDVRVFPNPATDALNVEVNLDEVANVQIVDLTGKVVATQTVSNQGTATFNTANLSSGLYIVSIQTANGVVTEKVLVK